MFNGTLLRVARQSVEEKCNHNNFLEKKCLIRTWIEKLLLWLSTLLLLPTFLPLLPPSLFNKSQWWHRNHTRNTLWPIADCYSVSLHSRKHRTSIISFMICSLWTQLYQLSATLRSSAYIRHFFPSLRTLSPRYDFSVLCRFPVDIFQHYLFFIKYYYSHCDFQ